MVTCYSCWISDHLFQLMKVQLYGLDDNTMLWFNSYLSDRNFQVCVDNQFSSKIIISSGVPQCSIFGPLLFILHMNDLPLHLDETEIDLYADDATKYVNKDSVRDVELKLNMEIQPIIHWIKDNKMTLNTTKTKAMVIGTSKKVTELPSDLSVTINGSQVETTLCEKVLGVHVDQTLTWSHHIVFREKAFRF